MEANKDEAYVCLDRARLYLTDGDLENAKKFINKSKKLFPTTEADEMKKQLMSNIDADGQNAKKSTPPGSPKEDRGNQFTYTEAELDMIIKVKNCKDYYEVLNIEKDATDTDIKKAYKKLALALHPDKNHAPGADEAFKTVVNAVATLTNETKRKHYNMVGHKIATSVRVLRDDDDDDDDILECISVYEMYNWLTTTSRSQSFEDFEAELDREAELEKSKLIESEQITGNKRSLENEELEENKKQKLKEHNEKNAMLEKEGEGEFDAK